ncbi:MAG: crossover junction endodeoxyribonuclease RuvC [Bacteroidia bacterium]|jgi:crossover junction endodeoxyribonuclease RuvC
MANEDRIIMGVDPGTVIMGFGFVHVKSGKAELLEMGHLKLDKHKEQHDRLKVIYDRCLELIIEHKPDELAVEAPFFGKNVQSMLKLGRAQGVVLATALSRNIPIFEYAPRKIKQSITGNGNASKEQVAAMLQSILKCPPFEGPMDASDGVAAAMCHYFQKGGNEKASYSGWSSFIKKNPGRIR